MQLPDKTYKRLTLLNFCLLLALLLIGLSILYPRRHALYHDFYSLIKQSLQRSKKLEILDSPVATEDRVPHYELKIKAEVLRKIEDLCQTLIANGKMEDRHKIWFPATFFHDKQEYKVKIRLRGDTYLHWRYKKKSWQIKFKKDRLFHGRRTINLIVPGDRLYEGEVLCNRWARSMGLLTPDVGHANLTINGVTSGIYVWIEKFGKEMLERQNYPVGEIFHDNNIWIQTAGTDGVGVGLNHVGDGLEQFPAYFTTYVHDEDIPKIYTDRWVYFLWLIREAPDDVFENSIGDVLDLEKFLKFNALTWRIGSWHARTWSNIRWYYNPTTGLFEPILYDITMAALDNLGTFEYNDNNNLSRRLLQISAMQTQRNNYLWDMIHDTDFDFVALSKSKFDTLRPHIIRGVNLQQLSEIEDHHQERLQSLAHNKDVIRRFLSFSRCLSTAYLRHSTKTATLDLKMVPDSLTPLACHETHVWGLDADNLNNASVSLISPQGLSTTLTVTDIQPQHNGCLLKHSPFSIWAPRDTDLSPQIVEWTLQIAFKTPSKQTRDRLEATKIDPVLVNTLTDTPIKSEYRFHFPPLPVSNEHPIQHDLEDVKNHLTSLSGNRLNIKDKTIFVPAGKWLLSQDLILPKDLRLHLEAGVQLQMAADASLVTFQPLTVSGTSKAPVVVKADSDTPWGTLAVINAGTRPSQINHLHLSGGNQDTLNGIQMTGQLCFYSSDVVMQSCRITHGQADDGLNIKNAQIHIQNCTFAHNSSDGFDGDWVKGNVESCVFDQNGGDGLDVSGADLVSKHCRFQDMGDKAISLGEQSRLLGFNLLIKNSLIGIASKDLSDGELISCEFNNCQTAVALYQKKAIFGPGHLKIINSFFWGNDANFELDAQSSCHLLSTALTEEPQTDNIISEDIHIHTTGPSPYPQQPGRSLTHSKIEELDNTTRPLGLWDKKLIP